MAETEYWIIYDLATGEERSRGGGTGAPARIQNVPQGRAILVVPAEALPDAQPADPDLIRVALWEKVKAARAAVIDAGTPIGGGKRVQTDLESRLNLAGLALAAVLEGDEFAETITTADNTTVTVNKDQMVGVALAARRHVSAAHARARALREQIEGAETLTELLKIDVEAGWPGEDAG